MHSHDVLLKSVGSYTRLLHESLTKSLFFIFLASNPYIEGGMLEV